MPEMGLLMVTEDQKSGQRLYGIYAISAHKNVSTLFDEADKPHSNG